MVDTLDLLHSENEFVQGLRVTHLESYRLRFAFTKGEKKTSTLDKLYFLFLLQHISIDDFGVELSRGL